MKECCFQHRLFEAFQKNSSRTAIEYGEKKITYSQLEKRAAAVCGWIVENKIEKGSFIGVYIDDKIGFISVMIGIIAAGGVCVPLDTALPKNRIDKMLRMTGTAVVFTGKGGGFGFITARKGLDTSGNEKKADLLNNGIEYRTLDPVYAYFTSGSTGTPRAVIGKNESLLHFINWEIDTFDIDANSRVSQLTNPGFDAFLRDVFVPLCAGGCLCIPERNEIVLDSRELVKWIDRNRVNVIHCVPGIFRVFNTNGLYPENFKYLKYILLSGEPIKAVELKNWYHTFDGRVQLVNLYGSTETTMIKTCYFLRKNDLQKARIPIGKPIRGAQVFIFDRNMEVCGREIPGEIVVRTPYGTLGYCNEPELTRERFTPTPFSNDPGDILYKTGDSGRQLPDGNIELMGRLDRQVKIRGARVELEEIENVLLTHKDISQAVVVSKEFTGGNYLCAYYVSKKRLEVSQLRDYLAVDLPDYMVPSYFMRLDRIPLTFNRKTNYNELPLPEVISTKQVVSAPPTHEVEKKLAAVWAQLLNIDEKVIGIDADFFQLGGHSLRAAVLASRVHKELNVRVPLAEIFRNPTLRQLSRYIETAAEEKFFSINSAEKREYYPLAPAQKRLYILQQMAADSTAYNMPRIIPLNRSVNIKELEITFKDLIRRHESLRTSFHMIDEEPVQKIHDHVEFEISVVRDKGSQTHHSSFIKVPNLLVRPFDLSRAPLLRVGLLKMAAYRYLLLVDVHHIIADGISLQLLAGEFMTLDEGEALLQLQLQYKDYALWQNTRMRQETLKHQESYWLKTFSCEIPVLDLPLDYPRPGLKGFEGSVVTGVINKEKTQALRAMAAGEYVTLYMVLSTVYVVLLSRIGGRDEIVIGSPTAGRPHADLHQVIGMFVNTLALRYFPNGEKRFNELLREVKERTSQAFDNQDYPFEELVEKVGAERTAGRNPLFDVMFSLHKREEPREDTAQTPYNLDYRAAKFDLTFTAVEETDRIQLHFLYSTQLFKKETIRRFLNYFSKLLLEILRNPVQKISRLELITEQEKKQVLYHFNDTTIDYPAHRTIHQLFEEQVERTPHHIALVGIEIIPTAHVTYKELNRKSDHSAQLLEGKGVKPGHIVGLMKDRSIEMVVGMMAILKAGAAYLPIEPGYPKERILYMLADSNAGFLVSEVSEVSKVSEVSGLSGLSRDIEVIDLSEIIGPISPIGPIFKKSPTHPTHLTHLTHPAPLGCIIYTSGSTGTPKGVMVEHRSVVNVVTWFARQYGICPGVHVLQLTSYTFDASLNQIFGSLLHGAALHVPGNELAVDVDALRQYIDTHCIHIINSVPMLIKEILLFDGKLESLQAVLSGADRLTEETRDQILERGYRLYNQYGPTEGTIDALTCECTGAEARVTLGAPISNVQCYILDRYFHPVPINVVGELYISGAGVTRGYLNQPELTAEKFPPAGGPLSFSASQLLSFSLYRTGDLCRWLPDGSVEFLGRMDHQVKIRGYRIELGEIENQLRKHENVKETAVLALEDREEKKVPYLCAYIVPKGQEAEDLRNYLARYLPEYMIPRHFVFLDRIPLTSGGKIDRRVLSELSRSGSGSRTISPTDELEKQLADLWAEILGIEAGRIGIHDNFFALGGHSLKAMVLASRIRKAFNVEYRLDRIFAAPSLQPMAEFIRTAGSAGALPSIYGDVTPVEKREYYPQSSAQKRIFFLHRFEHIGTTYHISRIYRITGPLNKELLEMTFKQLIRRHESLRTSFHLINDAPVQRVHDRVVFSMEHGAGSVEHGAGSVEQGAGSVEQGAGSVERGAGSREQGGGIREHGAWDRDSRHAPCSMPHASIVRPFDLSKPPLLRVGLVKISETEHLLLFEMHHIISDGISMTVLTDEFITLYSGIEEFPPIAIQYKDFAQWQQGLSETGALKEQEEHWLNLFPDAPDLPVLHLPTDHSRPDVFTLEGDYYGFKLEPAEVSGLKQMSAANETTLFMNLLAAFNILLFKYSGQHDIIVGSGIAGRPHPELQKVIGLFVNMLPLRNQPSNKKNYLEFLKEVKKNCIDAFENQDFLLEELVEKLNLKRDASRNPLFDVCLVNQNFQRTKKEINDLAIEPYQYAIAGQPNKTAKFDLTLFVYEDDTYHNIYIGVEYYKSLFDRDTIERMTGHFVNVLKGVIKEPGVLIADIDILSGKEKNQLLFDFNDTAVPYPGDKTLHRLFEEQVERTPDHVSLVKRTFYLTYRLLNERANQVANYLYLEESIQPDDRVGVLMGPSIDRVTAILGVLKAGGAYVPIDPGLPEERIKTMMDDADIGVAISQKKETWRLQRLLLECLSFRTFLRMGMELFHDIYSLVEDSFSEENPAFSQLRPHHLAYVIYTSGTTGKPKGVMVDHRSLVNLCSWHNRYYSITGEDRATQYAGFGFDASVWEMFPYLVKGASIYLINGEIKLDIHELNLYLEKHRITISFLPTQLCEQFMGLRNRWLKRLLTGGDKLRVFKRNSDVQYTLYNNYGPTENTVVTTVYPVEHREDNIPIGKPIANNRIYILNRSNLQVQPIGVPGELYIAGDSLARGYLNNPELTNSKFQAPVGHSLSFSASQLLSFSLYRTGDLARWRRDGNIQFLGRLDQQVKIRGYRIELGEIETRLLNHQWVKQACVIDREEPPGNKFICAYIQMNGKSLPGISLEEELKKYLSFSLPDYMIPACFVLMGKMPLTRSGKIDRKRLPVPQREEGGKHFIEPESETEIRLAKIWSEVLGINKEKIGMDSDFFQLGGHSLKTTVLQARIRETFNIKIPLAEIFRTPFIRELARYIDGKEEEDYPMEIGTEDEQMVLLKSGTTKRNLFFIHAGKGEVEGYMELVNCLAADYFYWGIRREHVVPRPLTIEEMARSYIKKIKTLQPRGPYHIAGWSIGGAIAFEMVHQLEKRGDAVGFFALIDTSPPLNSKGKKTPPYYIPEGKVKTLIHFIGASNREMVRWENWHPYCQQPVKFYKVSGDHFSIMEQPHVVSLANVFNTLL